MTDFQYEKDSDGIVTITMDIQGQSANTMNQAYLQAMNANVEKLRGEEGLAGVVIASAKKTFSAGADLKDVLSIAEEAARSDKKTRSDTKKIAEKTFTMIEASKAPLRLLEQLAVPVVAAINGAAVGGGYELCLACNYRVVVRDERAVVGLPEVTLGLLPGAGGVVRLTALLGLEKALPLLLQGKTLPPQKAFEQGLVDEVVDSADQLIATAKKWIKANPLQCAQPWDQKGFAYPGGGADAPSVRMVATVAPTQLIAKTRGLVPAPEKILDIAVNSMRMNFNAALRVESRGLTSLMMTPECRAAISTFFYGMNAVKSGRFRTDGEKWQAGNAAIIGAGMMGAGIAWAHASCGLASVLCDTTEEKAEHGKSAVAELCSKAVERDRMKDEQKHNLLSLIKPMPNANDVEPVDIIIEAVYEDLNLKEQVIKETFSRLGEHGIYGSNTSTLPISVLAECCPDPTRFIGLHFFSPVDKMQVVEIIAGDKTSAETVRKAYDYVLQIKKIPVVVNDGRGFFTSRVFGTYLDEGQALLQDGMSPVAIERAAYNTGMPVGPLAVHDEVSLELTKKAIDTHTELDKRLGVESGFGEYSAATRSVALEMVGMGRGGRHYGGGFYQYEGKSKALWDGLSQFMVRDAQVSARDAQDRLLYRQVVESLRCLDEGVLRSEAEANLASVFAIGFPAYTGGVLQFIQGCGVEQFAERAAQLEAAYGKRFAVTKSALDKLAALDKAAA